MKISLECIVASILVLSSPTHAFSEGKDWIKQDNIRFSVNALLASNLTDSALYERVLELRELSPLHFNSFANLWVMQSDAHCSEQVDRSYRDNLHLALDDQDRQEMHSYFYNLCQQGFLVLNYAEVRNSAERYIEFAESVRQQGELGTP